MKKRKNTEIEYVDFLRVVLFNVIDEYVLGGKPFQYNYAMAEERMNKVLSWFLPVRIQK